MLPIFLGHSSWAKGIYLPPLVCALTACQGLAPGSSATPAPQASLTASPAALSFGSVIVGSSASLTASLKATGAPVIISTVTSTSTEFVVSGVSLPASLDAGRSLNFTVTFTPQIGGAASGSFGFVSDAENSPTMQSADGKGTPAPPHSVDLSWDPSASPGVVGYYVYRRASGTYSRINVSPEASTTYTDAAVDPGSTYFYVVTAVDGNGAESVYSDKAKAVVPTP